ncbi:MAG: UDP-N-acetylmuramoyl-L-alanine--D-glutamate ligase [Bacilli bacterium]|nr:UDP-N-acetylmuramoyl-L-alanine--D-glutamate ligase [Bacilli bacterium]
MFEKKKIYIMGMARSGYEVAKLLAPFQNEILITDGKEQEKSKVEELEKLGIKIVITEKQEDYLDDTFDLVIKNPGIRFDTPCIKKAEMLGIKIINEVELAYHFLPKNTHIIAVTGSNGKTTTTTLIYEFLKQMNAPVHLGGNIGFPMSSLISKVKEGDYIVLEISAQQLHDMYDFKTEVSVLTNLTPVHIDFFGSYEYYQEMKKKIFMNHTLSDLAIINLDDEAEMLLTENISSNKTFFSTKRNATAYCKENAIYYGDEKIIDIKDIRIKGMHNYQNIMCAIIATKRFGIPNDAIRTVLSRFVGVEHRLEFVANIKGREFYNDSKATNVKSTEIAIHSFDKAIILLLGGLDRGHSFQDLADDMRYVKHVVCYGETKNRIKEFCDSINKDVTVVETLKEAVKVAYNLSEEEEVILLSPACASWDQYESFEKRGEDFKQIVETLK